MYHIKKDKRAYKSAALICEGLADALAAKPYNEISITDVCEANAIARTTFYRLFDTLDDVLMYQFDALFEESIRTYAEVGQAQQSFAKTIIDAAMKNRALISAIVSSGRSDLFSRSTKAKEDAILQQMNLQMNERDRLYCTEILTQLCFAVLGTWVNTGCRESAHELYEIMKREMKLLCEYI